jgi:RHS repeat-associated protein
LLERLSQLPEDGPVSGDDAWSCFQDLIEALPKDAEHSDPEDANFVAYVGVPKDELDEPYEWSGWPAGMARKGWALLAKQGKKEPEKLLAGAIDLRRAQQNYQEKKIQGLDGKVKALRRRIKVQESRLTRQRILPDGKTLQKVTRYEAHLSRHVDDQGNAYVYDAWNRIVQVTVGGTGPGLRYAYDALGRRIQEPIDSSHIRDLYVSKDWQVLEERDNAMPTTLVRSQYVWSPVYVDALVLRDSDPLGSGNFDQRLYVQQDANWNVTAVVAGKNFGSTHTGDVVERYVEDPYGQVTFLDPNTWLKHGTGPNGSSTVAWVYLHQGGRLDIVTALYYFRHRDYSPTLGRWMELDPMGYDRGISNLYVFGRGNPIDTLDPMGLQFFPSTKPSDEYVRRKTPGGRDFLLTPIPQPADGCSGWCFSVSNSRAVYVTVNKVGVSETGHGCPFLLKTFLRNDIVGDVIKDRVTPGATFSVDTCSKGCSCQNKKVYDGQKRMFIFKDQVIPLDPALMDPIVSNFKKGECSLVVTGSVSIIVGQGWAGQCCKDKK